MSIQICIITPISHLESYGACGEIDMSLSHMIIENEGNNPYAKYYREQRDKGRFVILDNSAFELEQQGKGLNPDIVLDAAEISNPSEVICTDVLFDSEATLKSAEAFIKRVRERNLLGKYQLMAVAQGNSVESYMRCLIGLMKIPEIDTIGISKLGVPISFLREELEEKAGRTLTNKELSDEVRKTNGGVAKAREMLMKKIDGCNMFNQMTMDGAKYYFDNQNGSLRVVEKNEWFSTEDETGLKVFHLLGGDNEWAHELRRHAGKCRKYIRSSDSSMPAWYGCFGKRIDIHTGKIEEIIGQKPDLENNEEQTEVLLNNYETDIYFNIMALHLFSK